ERLQSEHPRVAKKAEPDTKIQARPDPIPGWAMAVAKKEDEALAARVGNEPEDGEGSGYFSQFLHEWCDNILAVYRGPPRHNENDRCFLVVQYLNGHVLDIAPDKSCRNPEIAEALTQAIRDAKRPPMPTSFGGRRW